MPQTNPQSEKIEFVFTSTPMQLTRGKRFDSQAFKLENLFRKKPWMTLSPVEILVSILAFAGGFALAYLFK